MTQIDAEQPGHNPIRVHLRNLRTPFLFAALLLIVAVLLAYAPAFPGSFLWDDDSALLENPLIRQPGGLARIWFSTDALEYYPIFYTSLRAQWHLFGPRPAAYLAVNVALHALNAILLMLVLVHLCALLSPSSTSTSDVFSSSESPISNPQSLFFLLPSLLFALHPVNVFGVAWINQHKTVLSTFFYLLSILFFCRALVRADTRARSIALVFFIAALLTKPTMVLLPFFFALLGWLYSARHGGQAREPRALPSDPFPGGTAAPPSASSSALFWKPLIPFFAVALLTGLLRVGWRPPPDYALAPPRIEGAWMNLVLPGKIVLFYLAKLLFPARLMMVYPRWQLAPPDPLDLAPSLLILILTLALWRGRRTVPVVFLAWIFFLLGLFPVLGFVDNQYFTFSFVANHWLYMPMMGITALASLGVNAVGRVSFRLACLIAIFVSIALLLQSRIEASRFHNPVSYYERGVSENPDNIVARNNLANLYLEGGHPGRALPHYLEAVRIHPVFWQARIQAGKIFAGQGRFDEAIAQLESALETSPGNPEAHFHLGTVYSLTGNLSDAVKHLEASVMINPYDPVAFNNLGSVYFRAGYPDHAIACFEKALELNPSYESARKNLDWARE